MLVRWIEHNYLFWWILHHPQYKHQTQTTLFLPNTPRVSPRHHLLSLSSCTHSWQLSTIFAHKIQFLPVDGCSGDWEEEAPGGLSIVDTSHQYLSFDQNNRVEATTFFFLYYDTLFSFKKQRNCLLLLLNMFFGCNGRCIDSSCVLITRSNPPLHISRFFWSHITYRSHHHFYIQSHHIPKTKLNKVNTTIPTYYVLLTIP